MPLALAGRCSARCAACTAMWVGSGGWVGGWVVERGLDLHRLWSPPHHLLKDIRDASPMYYIILVIRVL